MSASVSSRSWARAGTGSARQRRRTRRRVMDKPLDERPSGAEAPGTEHGHGTAVLPVAAFVGADRERALLAVGDGAQPRGCDAPGDEEVLYRGGAPCAEGEVVFAGALLVGMALDDRGVFGVAGKPVGLRGQHGLARRGQRVLIDLEENAVADGLVEIGHRGGVGRVTEGARRDAAGRAGGGGGVEPVLCGRTGGQEKNRGEDRAGLEREGHSGHLLVVGAARYTGE